jgi:hypothetical protein
MATTAAQCRLSFCDIDGSLELDRGRRLQADFPFFESFGADFSSLTDLWPKVTPKLDFLHRSAV